MTTYDEDLSDNPFYQTFLQTYVDLFSQCVCEKWIICVPRRDSLPKHAFTLEDFTHHILKPIRTSVELKSKTTTIRDTTSSSSSFQNLSTASSVFDLSDSLTNGSHTSREDGSSPSRKWNFRTMADVKLEYKDKKLFFNIESARDCQAVLNNTSLVGHPRSISVLFEETYYTAEKQKYKVLCISSPLNSKVEDLDTIGENGDEDQLANGHSRTSLWNLATLRDCIDFLWLNGKTRALENFDAYIKLFLHNHQSLEDLPLAVQRDLVFDLYKKCLSFAVKSIVGTTSSPLVKSDNSKIATVSTSEDIIDGRPSSPRSINEAMHLMQNFKLATETYVLSGIYRQLINAITSALSFEDASLNKITRNMSDIHPQDLDISSIHWENLIRAKNELSRLSLHASPLAKLNCLGKTMQYLKSISEEGNENPETGHALSTEELLPIWVYLIVKTPMGNWIAQLQFLRQFRFSALNTPDNENSFLIVTLEASLAHLGSGKISGVTEAELDVGITCEIGDVFLRNLSSLSKDGIESPLAEVFLAIRQGSFCKLQELIGSYETRRSNIKANLRNGLDLPKLCHPLCNCSACNAVTKAESEANLKSIVELCNEDGLTLLHVACVYGRPKIVDFLLGLGAPYAVNDSQGMTPLHYAASRGHQNALLLVLHAGSELEPLDNNLNTPLHHAAMNGHESCVKALIYYAEHSRQIVGLSARNVNGDTPLHFAARFGFQGIVQILVEVGASITIPNTKQACPMDCAHDIHIVRILQRSLRRRSLTHTNHGDFVNIDVVRKDDTDRVVMLISEPQNTQGAPEENPVKKIQNGHLSSSPSETNFQISGRMKTNDTNDMSLKNYNVYGAKFVGNHPRRLSTNGSMDGSEISTNDCNHDIIEADTDFYVPSPQPMIQPEAEHLRKVPVENLESPPLLESKSATGTKRKRDAKEQGLRKLFNAFTAGDIPLVLYYLGIPAEELLKVEEIIPGEFPEFPPCHPLCSCNYCSAKNSGLDISINARNREGLTLLHLAVLYNIHPLVKILLKYKANPKLFSMRENKTPLQIAKEKYYYDIATTIEDWEAAIEASSL